jgi:hypothetical protein
MSGRKLGSPMLVAVALMAGAVPSVLAQSVCGPRDTPNQIFPGDPRWALDKNVYPATVNFATAAITASNPRSGNGSLELGTTGSLFDWAFFKRVAEGNAAWGLLTDVNCLTFDWWRDSYTIPDGLSPELTAALNAETWQEQTPVLRLLVRDVKDNQVVLSHLVWERWYNTRNAGIVPTENDQWHFENLTGQQLWRHFDGGLTYTNAGCVNTAFDGSDALQTYDIGGWVSNCYSSSAEVYGIMIGVGSMWPGEYHAFLDNVQLAFGGQQGFAVEDNFEFPLSAVPEPGSMVLLATGLLALSFASYRTRRRNPPA